MPTRVRRPVRGSSAVEHARRHGAVVAAGWTRPGMMARRERPPLYTARTPASRTPARRPVPRSRAPHRQARPPGATTSRAALADAGSGAEDRGETPPASRELMSWSCGGIDAAARHARCRRRRPYFAAPRSASAPGSSARRPGWRHRPTWTSCSTAASRAASATACWNSGPSVDVETRGRRTPWPMAFAPIGRGRPRPSSPRCTRRRPPSAAANVRRPRPAASAKSLRRPRRLAAVHARDRYGSSALWSGRTPVLHGVADLAEGRPRAAGGLDGEGEQVARARGPSVEGLRQPCRRRRRAGRGGSCRAWRSAPRAPRRCRCRGRRRTRRSRARTC